MNMAESVKYDLIPEEVGSKTINTKEYREAYNFPWSEKVQQDAERRKKIRGKNRSEKQTQARYRLFKSTTENRSFYKKEIFVIFK